MYKMLDRFSATLLSKNSFQLKTISVDPGRLRVCFFHKLVKVITQCITLECPQGPMPGPVAVSLPKEGVWRYYCQRKSRLWEGGETCLHLVLLSKALFEWFVCSNLYYNPEEDILQMTERRVPDVKWFIQDRKHNNLDLNPGLCCQRPSLSTTLGNSQMSASWWLGCFSVSSTQTTLRSMWRQWTAVREDWCAGISREGLMRMAIVPETKNQAITSWTWSFMWILHTR